jgi:hypothetical protein
MSDLSCIETHASQNQASCCILTLKTATTGAGRGCLRLNFRKAQSLVTAHRAASRNVLLKNLQFRAAVKTVAQWYVAKVMIVVPAAKDSFRKRTTRLVRIHDSSAASICWQASAVEVDETVIVRQLSMCSNRRKCSKRKRRRAGGGGPRHWKRINEEGERERKRENSLQEKRGRE